MEGGKYQGITTKSEERKCPLDSLLLSIMLEILYTARHERHTYKRNTKWKGNQVFLFEDNITVYIIYYNKKALELVKTFSKDQKDGSEVWSSCCSFRRPKFSSQHAHGGSQPPVTPVSGDPMPSSGLLRPQTCIWYTYRYAFKHPYI